MMRLNSFLSYSAILIVVLNTSSSFAESGWRFKAATDVPRDQQNILRQDMDAFAKMSFVIKDATFNKVMGLQGDVKPKDLVGWLALRAKYLVSESYEMNEKNNYVASNSYNFQFPGIFPDVPTPTKTPDSASPDNQSAPSPSEPKVVTVMSNIGSSLYLAGKMNHVLLGINVPGLGKVPVTSPRVGLLQIGQGLFRIGRTKNNAAEIDSSLMRISTLFHESRHSDGNRKSTGFLHAICPTGHTYAGYAGCDFSLNGSYSVGYQVGKAMAENCATCTVAQREALRLDYLDSLSRVIVKHEVSPATEAEIATLHTLNDTCKLLSSYGASNDKVSKMCEGLDARILKAETKQIIEASYLDAAPEGRL